jgi:hypothetical protein
MSACHWSVLECVLERVAATFAFCPINFSVCRIDDVLEGVLTD